jgi:hypothetical protein
MKALAASKDAALATIRNLKWEDLSQPGPERLKHIVPTVGHVIHVIGSHWTMHVGQFQVIRRKLGKPVLF